MECISDKIRQEVTLTHEKAWLRVLELPANLRGVQHHCPSILSNPVEENSNLLFDVSSSPLLSTCLKSCIQGGRAALAFHCCDKSLEADQFIGEKLVWALSYACLSF